MTSTRDISVFVSHSNSDMCPEEDGSKKQFFEYAKMLLESTLRLRAVIREDKISGGPLRESILKMISVCDYQIVLLTPSSLSSRWVIFEFGAGLAGLGSNLREFPIDKRWERVIVIPEYKRINLSRRKEKKLFAGLLNQHWRAIEDPNIIRIDNKRMTLWPSTFKDDKELLKNLRKMLFQDTFSGRNGSALGHKNNKPRNQFKWDEYVKWLENFSAWTEKSLFAVSRESLRYWLIEAKEYRDILNRNIKKGLQVKRLSLWSKNEDIIPINCSDDELKDLWRSVGRTGKSEYRCPLCVTYDLLYLFLIQCHKPIEKAYYAFPEALTSYHWVTEFEELLIYENEYVLTANFSCRGAVVKYALNFGEAEIARRVKNFVNKIDECIEENIIRDYSHFIPKYKWTIPAWGKIDTLINDLELFHNRMGCSRTLSRPTNA